MLRQVAPVLSAGVGAAGRSYGEDPMGIVGTMGLYAILRELDAPGRRTILRGEFAKELLDCISKFPGEDALEQAQSWFNQYKPN